MTKQRTKGPAKSRHARDDYLTKDELHTLFKATADIEKSSWSENGLTSRMIARASPAPWNAIVGSVSSKGVSGE